MKEQFQSWRPSGKIGLYLESVQEILAEYKALDIKLTLRQLYYQLVSRNKIKNCQKEYARLSRVLTDARMAGLIDWSAIEDRIRRPELPSEWDSISDLVDSAIHWYRLPRWNDQTAHVELWCEKDALHSILEPIANDLHVTLMINRGYSSTSAAHDAANRFKYVINDAGKSVKVLYLGDFDPSGEDMVRDISSRMQTFGVNLDMFNINKLALTPEQVKKHRLPPNPAKRADPRSKAFIDQHGAESFEVDALPPQVLMKLVRGEIEGLMDRYKYEEVLNREEEDKQHLVQLVNSTKRRTK